MNAFNRILALLVSALLIFAAAISLVALFGGGNILPANWFDGYVGALDGLSGTPFVLAVIFSILTILVFLTVLILEIPRPARKGVFLVRSDEHGDLTVDPESVQRLVEAMGQEIRGVRQIRCGIGERMGGLAITCHPIVSLGADIPGIASELQQRTKDRVEKAMGLPVHDVTVKARYETARERRLVPQ